MSSSPLHTKIWHEQPEANNPFATLRARCYGYDVYGQMLGHARWADMIFLLFRGEAPTPVQAQAMDILAVALANPGPRDPMVHAAMCGGVGGSHAAASLMAALAVGAGQSGGGRAVYLAMQTWQDFANLDHAQRLAQLTCGQPLAYRAPPDAGWPDLDHPPSFDPHGVTTSTIVLQTLAALKSALASPHLTWLDQHRGELEQHAGLPLAMVGVIAAAFADLGFSPTQGEMLHLVLRLPGAAAHALEQAQYGFKRFPYPEVDLLDDPANRTSTEASA